MKRKFLGIKRIRLCFGTLTRYDIDVIYMQNIILYRFYIEDQENIHITIFLAHIDFSRRR